MPASSPHFRPPPPGVSAAALAALLLAHAATLGAAPFYFPADDSSAARVERVAAIDGALLGAGLENVAAETHGTPRLTYENRRFRHSAEALARARVAAGGHTLAFERRLGLVAAAVEIDERRPLHPFLVRYPSERDFPRPPRDPLLSPTFMRADLEAGPLVYFQIGHIFDPLELRVELEPRLRLNPWPGAALRAGLLLPITNDFPESEGTPDLGRVRPGRSSLEQFAWLPGVALLSASGGYFGDNRYGASLGLARPIDQGRWLIDAQVDRTGYLAFAEEGTLYSSLDQWSGFAGVTLRPPFRDFALRVRGARFQYGDRGVEVEVRRVLGDFEVAGFGQRSAGANLYGVRLDLPVPPLVRAPGSALRVQPVPRFPLEFRDRSQPSGVWLAGVASREEYLRQLSDPSLEANLDRYRRALGEAVPATPREPPEWVSISGMTGFINTPWAGVMADRGFEAGYNLVPRRWAYDHRGLNDNQVYYATLGFLPHLETSLRWTRIAGYHSFQEFAPDSRLVDMDRMASGRIEFLPPRLNRPGLAAGVEDAQGTRRFHSTYGVAGAPLSILGVHGRVALGYGFRALKASRYVLDGAFGALELSPWMPLRAQLEFDSEKWNVAAGLAPGAGFNIRAALLHLESLSLGGGWSHSF